MTVATCNEIDEDPARAATPLDRINHDNREPAEGKNRGSASGRVSLA
jgi:hypothetical protein